MLDLPEFLKQCKLFPCAPGGKVPAVGKGVDWQAVATDDPAKIAEWLAINPDFNWAVACGPSNLFVIDIDPEGLEYWNNLLANDPALKAEVDQTFQVKTPRGGYHVYFQGEGPTTASRIAKGVDTRSGIKTADGSIQSGGYVLLPGSRTDAGRYHVAVDAPMASTVPEIVKSLIPAKKQATTEPLEVAATMDASRNIEWVKQLLEGYVASGRVSIEGAGGNSTAFQVVASVLDKAISPAKCLELLQDYWNPHCQPPWADWELQRVIENAAKYGEETGNGAKGIQDNADVFAAFASSDEAKEAAKPRERDRIKFLHDYADNVRDPEWLIPNMIPATGVGMLYGESGSYKSFVALDMALCLAFGVAGQWGAPPVKHDVLFLAGEGPVSTAKKRWPAWMEWQGLDTRTEHRMLIKDRVPFYTDTNAWEYVKQDLDELEAKPSLIVVDTLTRLLTGMDENSTKDANTVVNFMEELARHYECFVLAIHHTGKDQSKGARGSSVFYANMDTVISTKLRAGQGTEIRVRKQKDADVSDEVHFLAVKEVGQSIVLEKSEAPPTEQMSPKQSSRYGWASLEEVVKILGELGGEASANTLEYEIGGKYGVDPAVVRKQLAKSDQLAFLKDRGKWKLPSKQEFDL